MLIGHNIIKMYVKCCVSFHLFAQLHRCAGPKENKKPIDLFRKCLEAIKISELCGTNNKKKTWKLNWLLSSRRLNHGQIIDRPTIRTRFNSQNVNIPRCENYQIDFSGNDNNEKYFGEKITNYIKQLQCFCTLLLSCMSVCFYFALFLSILRFENG